ncbi:hypothetical protein [Mucilaginibacter sp. SP1R1]|uniref:hypothetical protein n=1 Tax=Mucilaginibacter sp. SP1R1 TaxID=2723091 RepID=UPI00160D501A|nr:hypothetical protein [Mucilaginibacter sp. SP1R1]MBB6152746.1 hypothetical protein [Mucilaginibacter sp. SP1R1]
MNKALFGILILGCFFGQTINAQTQNEPLAIQRILYFYRLKGQLADKVWPGFGLPQYDVTLAYFTHNNTYIIDPSGLVGNKKTIISTYRKGKITIEKTERLDTISFHMATAYEEQDSSSLWYHNPVMLCSDYETTRKYVQDVPNLQTWTTMVMHEYFHGFQFRHRAFISFANDSVTISITKLQSYYDRYSWFKESVDKENQLLLDCLNSSDLIKIKQLFNQYNTQRNWRLKHFYELQKFDLSTQEEFLEKMEGSARYMEYQLYLTFKNLATDKQLSHIDTAYKPLALKTFALKDKPWMYESNSIRYFYSTGFNMLRLLDNLHVIYKKHFFDDNDLTPYKLLNQKIGNAGR